MSNYALQLDAASYVQFANNTSLEAATKVWGAFRVKGDFLNAVNGVGGYVAIDLVCDSGFTAFKAGLLWAGPNSAFGVIDSSGGIIAMDQHSGTAVGSFNSALYYDVRWVMKDAGNVSQSSEAQMDVYAAGDLGGTALATWWTLTTVATMTTSGRGTRRLGCTTDAGFSGVSLTVDWAKIGNDASYSYEDAQLEEGSGSSVSPSGTITGSFTWIAFSSIADDDTGVPGTALRVDPPFWIATVFS